MTDKPATGVAPAGGRDAADLREPWLTLARLGVVATAIIIVTLFIIWVPVRYQTLITPCAPVETCRTLQLSQLEVATMPAWLTIETYASYQVTLEMVLAVLGLAVGALIFYRVSHTRMGLLAAVIMIFFGVATEVSPAIPETVPATIYVLVLAALYGVLVLFVMVFPNGKVEPGWVRRRFPLILLAVVGIAGPLATLTVNVLGSLALSWLIFSVRLELAPIVRLALATGFLGAFTTFSTFELDLYLIAGNRFGWSVAYLVANVVLGYGAILLGRSLALTAP